MRKVHNKNFILDLTKTSNSSEELCDADSPAPILMASIMSRRVSNVEFNYDVNENLSFDKDYMILKEHCAALTPDMK